MPLNQIHHGHQTLHHHHHHHLDPYPTRPAMDNPPDLPSPSGTRKVELQGPRPTPLRVSKDSHKITKHKPPLHPKHQLHHRQETVDAVVDNRQPVIIYAVSPKVIHADPSNFMSIVQRLTGNTTTTTTTNTTATNTSYIDENDTGDFSVAASRGDEVPISPAARFAAIERTISPSSQRGRNHQTSNNDNGLMGLVGFDDEQLQQPVPGSAATGILSPAPGNLPVISSAMFSPPVDMQAMFGVQDVLSPLMFGHSFLPSPTGFLSPTLSPTLDFSNLFDNRFY